MSILSLPVSGSNSDPASSPRYAAEHATEELLATVRQLKLARFPFDVLSQGERDEILATIIGTEYVHVWVFLEHLNDEQLIAYAASENLPDVHGAACARELHRRIGKLVDKHCTAVEVAHVEAGPIYTAEPDSEPDADTRRQIEWDAEELARQEMFADSGERFDSDFGA